MIEPALLQLEDKICLVTGATDGIGFATSELLARRGAHVILTGRVADDQLEQRVEVLRGSGASVEGFGCDVTDPAQVSDCYQYVFKNFHRLDGLVANAGVLLDARLVMITEELLETTMQVNLLGVIRHLQSAARLMSRGGRGSIVATSSIIGTNGNAGQTAYGASKAGVIGAVRSAAKELAPSGVRVNAVAPGFIATRMIENVPEGVYEERVAQIGMGRPGTAEEVAEAIAFLISDAASYITGQTIGVDGGMVI